MPDIILESVPEKDKKASNNHLTSISRCSGRGLLILFLSLIYFNLVILSHL